MKVYEEPDCTKCEKAGHGFCLFAASCPFHEITFEEIPPHPAEDKEAVSKPLAMELTKK